MLFNRPNEQYYLFQVRLATSCTIDSSTALVRTKKNLSLVVSGHEGFYYVMLGNRIFITWSVKGKEQHLSFQVRPTYMAHIKALQLGAG